MYVCLQEGVKNAKRGQQLRLNCRNLAVGARLVAYCAVGKRQQSVVGDSRTMTPASIVVAGRDVPVAVDLPTAAGD